MWLALALRVHESRFLQVPGSACFDEMQKDKIKHGDILFSVDGVPLYRAPLKMVPLSRME